MNMAQGVLPHASVRAQTASTPWSPAPITITTARFRPHTNYDRLLASQSCFINLTLSHPSYSYEYPCSRPWAKRQPSRLH